MEESTRKTIAPMSPRRSFTKEFKLKAIRFLYDTGKIITQTTNKFKIDRKQIRNWVEREEQIHLQNRK